MNAFNAPPVIMISSRLIKVSDHFNKAYSKFFGSTGAPAFRRFNQSIHSELGNAGAPEKL